MYFQLFECMFHSPQHKSLCCKALHNTHTMYPSMMGGI